MSLNDIPLIDLREHTKRIQPDLIQAVQCVFESAAFAGGRFVEKFESDFAAFLGCSRFAAVSSGSDALFLALSALGVGRGDEVIVPANTFIATAFSVVRVGAVPVFVDCDPDLWQISLDDAERAISSKTKAIIGVHMYGQAFPVNEFAALAAANNIWLLEDCAQSHGTKYCGRMVGTLSDAGCFSFYPTKNLGSCGQAGGVALADKDADKRLRMMREQGSCERYLHDIVGYNMRMDGIQAAILSAKLPHLNEWNKRRAEIVQRYHSEINNPALKFQGTLPYTDPGWYLAVVCAKDRIRFMADLEKQGIFSQIHYPVPCHLQKSLAYLDYHEKDFPNAEYLADHCVSLPLYPEMSDSDVDRVINACNSHFLS